MLDQKSMIDDLLADWHIYASRTAIVSMPGKCAMFAQSQSPRHWDTTGDIDDAHIHQSTMAALDFAILGDTRGQGGLDEPYRAAVTCYARNLVAKVSVWSNPRLPTDQMKRIEVTNHALEMLAKKLKSAGVL